MTSFRAATQYDFASELDSFRPPWAKTMAGGRPPGGSRLPLALMGIGSQMAGSTVVGVLLDVAIGSMPAFTIGLTLLGFVLAFVQLVRFTKTKFGPPQSPPAPPGEEPR